jgi:hypothetical protein
VRAVVGRVSLAFLLGLALALWVIALNGPTWVLLLAMAAWGSIYWRYRWRSGIRDEMIAARGRGLARGLEKQRRHREAKENRRVGDS